MGARAPFVSYMYTPHAYAANASCWNLHPLRHEFLCRVEWQRSIGSYMSLQQKFKKHC